MSAHEVITEYDEDTLETYGVPSEARDLACYALDAATRQAWEDERTTPDSLFNTKCLARPSRVKPILYSAGFEDVSFATEDGHVLSGYLKRSPYATCTVIFVGGFYPGNPEGITTFAEFLKKTPCNILFFKGRHHGIKRIGTIRSYGLHEWKDVAAAIQFVRQQTTQPIVIHGVCAGAFHAAHALIHLKDQLDELNVKGFVADSIWGSVKDVMGKGPKRHFKQKLKHPLFYGPVVWVLQTYRFLWFKRHLESHHETTQLFGKMNNINVPTLFVHYEQDHLTPYQEALTLYQEVPEELRTLWAIPEGLGDHTNNHLKAKHVYQPLLLWFLHEKLKLQNNF